MLFFFFNSGMFKIVCFVLHFPFACISGHNNRSHYYLGLNKFELKVLIQTSIMIIYPDFTGTSQNGTAFGLQMSQAGFSSHIVEVSLAQISLVYLNLGLL